MTGDDLKMILKRRLANGEIDLNEYETLSSKLNIVTSKSVETEGEDAHEMNKNDAPLFNQAGLAVYYDRFVFCGQGTEAERLLLADINDISVLKVARFPFAPNWSEEMVRTILTWVLSVPAYIVLLLGMTVVTISSGNFSYMILAIFLGWVIFDVPDLLLYLWKLFFSKYLLILTTRWGEVVSYCHQDKSIIDGVAQAIRDAMKNKS